MAFRIDGRRVPIIILLCLSYLLQPSAGRFCTDETANMRRNSDGELVMDHAALMMCPQIKWPMSKNLGPEGAKALANELKINTRTNWIWLYNNAVEQEGAEAIALTLKDYDHTLRVISLYGNDIRVRGAKAFGEMLKHNHRMRELFLGANSIGDEGATALADGLF